MQADLWGWFYAEQRRARRENDPHRAKLPDLYDSGWNAMREERGQEALSYFQEALQIARYIEDPCWELFFEHWSNVIYLFTLSDYVTALENVVQTAAHAHKPQYLNCPIRARVYYSLLFIYYEMDPFGYEAKVREVMEYMETSVPLDEDTIFRIQYKKGSLAYLHEDYDTAEKLFNNYLNMLPPHADLRMAGGYSMLGVIAYCKGDFHTAIQLSHQAETFAHKARLQGLVGEELLWRAVYEYRIGNTEQAKALHEQGIAHFERYQIVRNLDYFNAICEYLEINEEIEAAINAREEANKIVHGYGSPDYDVKAAIQYCRLLGRHHKDIADAIQQAEQAMTKLLKPDYYEEKLARIRSGDFTEYHWQQ